MNYKKMFVKVKLRYILILMICYIGASRCFDVPSFGRSIYTSIYNGIASGVCHFRECCHESSIPANFDELELTLARHVYGQHLVQDIVVNALRSHWDDTNQPQKALTLSFHGWPGSGKNYVTKFIIDSLYSLGSKSKFVHQFVGRIHFPRQDMVDEYQINLYKWIKGNVSKCPRQLFVFDEVDKMPSQVLNAIKPMIDYRDDVEGVDYRQAIFIFLSNTGAEMINEHFLELWKKGGRKRDDLKLKDFERLIALGAFNEEGWLNKQGFVSNALRPIVYNYFGLPYRLYLRYWAGGFHRSDTITSNLIDHYVPFLPMERHHVKMCIWDQFVQRNVTQPREDQINEAMDFIEWGPSEERLFSKTGCKRLSQKVGIIVAKNRLDEMRLIDTKPKRNEL